MQKKVRIIEELRSKLLQCGGLDAIDRLHKKSKLTARERVEKLLDPRTFYEIEMFSKPIETGLSIGKEAIRGDGLISGYGLSTGVSFFWRCV